MPSRYISFVVRIFVRDEDQMAWGRLYRVPEREGEYFRNWDELIAMMKEHLHDPKGNQASPPSKEPG
jgi:hypothetical protein